MKTEELSVSQLYNSYLKLSYDLMKDSLATKVFSMEEIIIASLFVAIKMQENSNLVINDVILKSMSETSQERIVACSNYAHSLLNKIN